MIVTRWRNLVSTTGRREQVTFAALGAELVRWCSGEPFRGDREHPGWAPAIFRGDQRALDRVVLVGALALDLDHVTSIEAALAPWRGRRAIWTTTRRHTAAAPRLRVVVELSRPVTTTEHGAIWRAAAAKGARVGVELDQAAKDCSRFWFLPSRPIGGAAPAFGWLAGEPIDVDAVLAWVGRVLGADRRAQGHLGHGQGHQGHQGHQGDREQARPIADANRYAAAALDHAVDAIRDAAVGERNATAVREAFTIARFVAAGDLARADVERALVDAAIAAGLPHAEAEQVIANGLGAGIRSPGARVA